MAIVVPLVIRANEDRDTFQSRVIWPKGKDALGRYDPEKSLPGEVSQNFSWSLDRAGLLPYDRAALKDAVGRWQGRSAGRTEFLGGTGWEKSNIESTSVEHF